ncbi:MAG: glycosyltransferase [Deltaproteobacteria bacterium]|nr:glycosyltransferase [Deltaproteobacteria bacterium]
MKLVIFGLTVSSSWGNGHATIWRAVCRALGRRGHHVVFYERDVPYYASHRDVNEVPGGKLRLYKEWRDVLPEAESELAGADVGMVTSYCPDGVSASELVLGSSAAVKAFYDLDTPVTLATLAKGRPVAYLGRRGLRDFDVVLSFTGGKALEELQAKLGARRVFALYGCADPEAHRRVPRDPRYEASLSYLGTYAEDRQSALSALFVEPSRRLKDHRFVLGGSLYPEDFAWTENIHYLRHVPPPDHPAFYSSSRFTLNVTRGVMAAMGYCPSGRLFEAAACGVPVLSDSWEGFDQFFTPGEEVLVPEGTEGVVEALSMPEPEREKLARAARERVLAEHTADHRVQELEAILSTWRA